jgi:hypothetical protein
MLSNFPNVKQTQESLENGFSKNEFRETNIALNGEIDIKNCLRVSNLFVFVFQKCF